MDGFKFNLINICFKLTGKFKFIIYIHPNSSLVMTMDTIIVIFMIIFITINLFQVDLKESTK